MKVADDYPDPRLIAKLLKYEPDTGRLFWRHRPEDMFKPGIGWNSAASKAKRWNTIYAGTETGLKPANTGYIPVTILGKPRPSHRLIWAIQTGEWPKDQVDHINQDRSDNRWKNLRQSDNAKNCKNQQLQKNNKSGHAGVWKAPSGNWTAFINEDNKRVNLGTYKKIEDAISVREAAKKRLGYSENHGVSYVN